MKKVKVHDETFRVCSTRELESLEMPDNRPVSHFRDTNSALWNGVAVTGTNIGDEVAWSWSQHLEAFSSFSFWMTICYIGVFHWQSCGSRQPYGKQMRWTLRLLGPSCSDVLTSIKRLVLLGWRYWLYMCACIFVGSVCVCMHAWVCEILIV